MRNVNRIQNSIFLIVFFIAVSVGLFCLFSKIYHFYMINGLLKTEQIQWYVNTLYYLLPCCFISYFGFKIIKLSLFFDNYLFKGKLILSILFYCLQFTFLMLVGLSTLFFLLDKFYNNIELYYLFKFGMIAIIYFYVMYVIVKLCKYKLSDWQKELDF